MLTMDHSVPATRMFIHKWNKPFVRRSHFAGAVFSHHPFPADPICSERVTMHCQWGRKPPKLPFPLRISSLAGRGPSNDHRQHTQKIGKDRACGSGYMLADTHTHTHIHTERERERERDVLITILQYSATAFAGEVMSNTDVIASTRPKSQ